MLSVAVVFTLNIITSSHAYYLSLSEIKWQNASNYCRDHCHSQLASIHTEEDYQNIKQLLEYYKPYIVQDVSIGLNNVSGQGFEWSDTTDFDYANVAVGIYPWRSNRPKGAAVVVLNKDTFELQDVGSSGRRHFLCNHCDGVITKYVIPNIASLYLYQYNQSQQYCRDTFGTTLASLHNDNDMREAQIICKERTNSNGCWIGIYDENSNLNFQQDDQTSFDYGNEPNGNGLYPWSSGQPANLQSNMDSHCVLLEASEYYLWNGNTSCVQFAPKPICNIPSEICYPNAWQVIYGSDAWNFNSNFCELSHSETTVVNLIKLYRKHWSFSSGSKLIIELMFSIENGASLSEAGLYLFASTGQDYFIGIGTENNNIFLRATGNYLKNSSLDSVYSFGMYYMLQIEILNSKMNVHFNNTEYFDYLHVTTNQNISVGIQHTMSAINIKSLYVSGSPYVDYNATPSPMLVCDQLLLQCAPGISVARDRENNCEFFPCPTASPPTIFECNEDKNAVITITFEYILETDASQTQIENVLINVTNSLVEKDVQILSNCNITDYSSEIDSIEDNTAEIEVSICYICNDKITLNVPAIQNNLTTDFIQAIDDNTNLLAILPGSTIVTVNEKETDKITSTLITKITEYNSQKDNTFRAIMLTVLVLLCVCIIIFVAYVYMKKISDKRKDVNSNDGIALSIAVNPAVKVRQQHIINEGSTIDDISMHSDGDIVGDVNTITAGAEITGGNNAGGEHEQRVRGYTPVAVNYMPNHIEKLQNNVDENELIIEDDKPTNDGNTDTVKDDDIVVMGDEEIRTDGNL